MKILFIGQNPSKDNLDENVAFIGSRSHTTLVEWIHELGVKNEELTFVNASKKLGKVGMKDANLEGLIQKLFILSPDKIVCLGNYSTKVFTKAINEIGWTKFKAFQLPHPSGLNRKLNDPEYVSTTLKACRKYLTSKV